MAERFRSGDALFATGSDMSIVVWNAAAERLTGIPASEAVGRPCWDVLRGLGEDGGLVCHPGCSGARLAREGWPVPCRRLRIRTANGRRLVSASIVAVEHEASPPVILHVVHDGGADPAGAASPFSLTRRQRQVLGMLADGLTAKVIARELGIAEVTARNHIQAILTELHCHSQLEAVAIARRRGLV